MAWPNDVRRSDLRIDYYRGSGAGGQNRNKRDTACRITHIPTGLAATAEEHRTQGRNRKAAFHRLAKRLIPLMMNIESSTQVYSERIRTYHEPDQRVTDKRLPKRIFDYRSVLDGNALDKIITELLR